MILVFTRFTFAVHGYVHFICVYMCACVFQILVFGVVTLTSSVVAVVYIIGLPHFWNKSPTLTCILIVLGHWLLINVVFHFTMAAATDPGTPPKVILALLHELENLLAKPTTAMTLLSPFIPP